ncbi:MAG TPA: STAS/SEC14 domain-containing protein [Novimethylophilus sp.]|uniref:STAS/SEC14 domain-containing protein n=1 Tax=Novimethylophilus sp. TaxID=2137426 RepID=UPI002F429677
MITLNTENHLVSAAVLGEFTITDFRELEQQIEFALKFNGKTSLLVDLRDMLSMTLDVALEELRFTRSHRGAFEKIAVVTENTLQQWEALLSNLFTDAVIEVFENEDAALEWLNA